MYRWIIVKVCSRQTTWSDCYDTSCSSKNQKPGKQFWTCEEQKQHMQATSCRHLQGWQFHSPSAATQYTESQCVFCNMPLFGCATWKHSKGCATCRFLDIVWVYNTMGHQRKALPNFTTPKHTGLSTATSSIQVASPFGGGWHLLRKCTSSYPFSLSETLNIIKSFLQSCH